MCLASDLKTDCVSYGKDLCWAGDTVYEWSGWMALGWEELALCLFHYFSAFGLPLCVWPATLKLTVFDKQKIYAG